MGLGTQIISFAKGKVMPFSEFKIILEMLPVEKRFSFAVTYIFSEIAVRLAWMYFTYILFEKIYSMI